MPTSQTIYVDMDDVLCETARGCLEIVERVFGKRVAYEQLADFDLGNACALAPDETAELYHIVHHPDELLKLKPVSGAIPVLNKWIAAGFEIAIVTGQPPATYEPSLDWLVREQVPYRSFTVVDKYRRFTTEKTIAVSLSELAARQFVFAVEDSPTMARYLAGRCRCLSDYSIVPGTGRPSSILKLHVTIIGSRSLKCFRVERNFYI